MGFCLGVAVGDGAVVVRLSRKKVQFVSSGIEEIMVSSQLNSELIFDFNYLCYCAVCMSVYYIY